MDLSEGPRQIRVTAMVVFRPLQQQIGIGVASCADDIVHPSAILAAVHRWLPRELAQEGRERLISGMASDVIRVLDEAASRP